MIFINILLGIAAGILFFGVVGEKDKAKHKNITIAFVATLLFTLALNFIL